MAKKLSSRDYERLGRMLQSIYETGYTNPAQAYRFSFLKGIAAGFGGVIGATIVVAILAWVLSFFHNVPLLNKLTDNVRSTVEHSQIKTN